MQNLINTKRFPKVCEKHIYWVDLFCGAGGVSLGIYKAGQSVLACVNHDTNAILSHEANHPDAMHFIEDIRTIELSPIIEIINSIRKQDSKAKICLWASLECTSHSKAKGGESRDADSRTLAEHLPRYLEAIDFDFIYIENVEEFMSWGPLVAKVIKSKDGDYCPLKYDKNGKCSAHWIPESRTKGRDYIAWVKSICAYGYHHSHKILNCADFGDPTKRFRYFGIFAKNGVKISFPIATHAEPKKLSKYAHSDMFANIVKAWRPVKECLDFSDTGSTIFGRKKPLVEKSLRRIYAGLIKYVMNNDKDIEKYVESIAKDIYIHTENSSQVLIPIIPSQTNIKPFITKYMSNSPTTGISVPQDIDNPSGTITTQGRFGLVQAFLAGYYSSKDIESDKGKLNSIENPSPTITTVPHQSLVFLQQYYSLNNAENQSSNILSTENASPTIMPNNKLGIVFLNRYNGQPEQMVNAVSIETPSPTLTTNDRLSLISTVKYLINPQYECKGSSVDSPCFTLIARMDKMPPYIVNGMESENNSQIAALVAEANDSLYFLKIKVCMALYGLCDIKMRMLNIMELKQIQSFPKDYVLIGTQAEQKKYIGNAVPSETVMNLVKCLSL